MLRVVAAEISQQLQILKLVLLRLLHSPSKGSMYEDHLSSDRSVTEMISSCSFAVQLFFFFHLPLLSTRIVNQHQTTVQS